MLGLVLAAVAVVPGTLAVQVVEKPRESVVVSVRYELYAGREAAVRFAALVSEGTDPADAARAVSLEEPDGRARWWEWKRGGPLRPSLAEGKGRWKCRPAQVELPGGGVAVPGRSCWRSRGGLLETEQRALGLVLGSERAFETGGEKRVVRSLRTLAIYRPATTFQAPSAFFSSTRRLSSFFSRHSSPVGVVNNAR